MTPTKPDGQHHPSAISTLGTTRHSPDDAAGATAPKALDDPMVGVPRTPSPSSSRHTLRSFADLAGADGAFSFELVKVGDALIFAEVEAIGSPAFVDATRALEGCSARAYFGSPGTDGWPSDIYRPDQFVTLSRRRAIELGAWQMQWQAAGISHTLGMTISDGDTITGGVVCARLGHRERFGRPQRERLRRVEVRIGQALGRTFHRRLRSCDAPGQQSLLLFEEDGTLVATDPHGPGWLDEPTLGRIGSLIRAREGNHTTSQSFVRRAPVRLHRLAGRRPLVAAVVTEPERYRPGPLRKLTPVQRQVAHIASLGATIEEIACHLERSRATVHHHLKGIYARLEIGCRVELARLMAPGAG